MPSISPDPHSPEGRPAPLGPEQLLPPVEPPSARFLLQLFVVPAVIVAGVVLVWFVIESLARSGEQDPQAILQALRSSNQARFQQANDLAEMLRTPERYELSGNHELAAGMGAYLDELVEEGSDAESEVTMRYFLASALGEFRVADGLPALLAAARNDPQRDVRRKAVNALAALAGTMGGLEPPERLDGDELVELLVDLSRDEDELVRSETAFAIGVVAGAPDADARLVDALAELADDPYTDARFNAAAGLARLGDARAAAAVAEMLDPEAIAASLSGEKAVTPDQTEASLRSQRSYKRNTILTSALSAIDMLLARQPTPETLAALDDALGKFLDAASSVQEPAPLPKELVDAARRTRAKVQAARGG